MRQRLGKKKHAKCERITGKKYLSCLVRGGTEHFRALCWFSNKDADYVNYKTGRIKAAVRNGQFVSDDLSEIDKVAAAFMAKVGGNVRVSEK